MLMRALLSHYRRHPLQLLALWLIMTLATALWSGVWTLTQQARDSMASGEQQLAGRQQVVRADGAPVTVADFVSLRRQGLCVMPWLEVEREAPGRLIGVDPLAMGCASDSGDGGGFELDGEPFVDIARAAERAQQGRAADLRLLFSGDAGELPGAWRVRADASQLSTGELADSFLLNLDALCVLVVLITALLIRSVFTLGLSQRRHGLVLLERYGVRRPRIRRYLLLELALLSLLASVPGYWLGLQLAAALGSGFGAALENLFDVPLLAGGGAATNLLVVSGVMVLVILWCGADFFVPRRWLRWHGLRPVPVGGLVLTAGLVLLVLASTLVLIFTGVALMLAGVGLLTPALLSALARRGRPQRPLALWSRRETGVLVRRLGLPLVALQFAAATVIAVHALVTTFEATFNDWLDQRLNGDVYVEVPAGGTVAQAAPVLSQFDDVAWHPVLMGRARVDGRTVDMRVTDPDSPLLASWRFLSGVSRPWEALAGDGVLINEQLARRSGRTVGESLTLTLGTTELQRTIAGIYADYGRPAGELVLGLDQVPPDFTPRYASLTLSLPRDQRGRAFEALRQAWEVSRLQRRDNATVRELATAVFEQTFVLTRAISLLTLALAAASVLITGWVVFRARSWYYRLLEVWGLSRRELRWRLRKLAVGLMLRIGLTAIPPGLVLTWALVARINPTAFGWSLPMGVYPFFWLELLLILVVIGLVIAALILMGERGAPRAEVVIREGTER